MPVGVVALFALGGVVAVWIDATFAPSLTPLAFGGGAPAARSVLTTVAGSFVTVGGLSLSLTIVVVQLVAGQLTPRAVRGLLDDRTNQLTAGTLFGVFAYCLVVLRAVRDETPAGPEFAAPLGVDLAVALALAALVLLLVFIHHVAESLQVSTICARIASETSDAIDRVFPRAVTSLDDGFEATVAAWRTQAEPEAVTSVATGFVQRIDVSALDDLGQATRVAIDVTAGAFVTRDPPVAYAWATGAGARDAAAGVRRAVVVGPRREMIGDPAFGIRQLADIALRAVSPGVNDPTTARTAIG